MTSKLDVEGKAGGRGMDREKFVGISAVCVVLAFDI